MKNLRCFAQELYLGLRRFCYRHHGYGLHSFPLRRRWSVILSMGVVLRALARPMIAQEAPDLSGAMHAGASVQVSKDSPAAPHGETEIAANPEDATQLVACSMLFPSDSPTSEVATYVSFDSGGTWKLALQTRGQDGHESWDPDCRFGPGHLLYSLSEGSGPDHPVSYDRIDRSNDGGKTWETPTLAVHAERSFIVVDNRPGPQNGRLYLYGMREDMHSIRVGYSTDRGNNGGPV